MIRVDRECCSQPCFEPLCDEVGYNGGFEHVRRRPSFLPRILAVFAQQVGGVELQDLRDFVDRLEARKIAAALESADVGPVKARLIGESLLGKRFRFPGRTKIACKTLSYVHRTHNSRLLRVYSTEYTRHQTLFCRLEAGDRHYFQKPSRRTQAHD